jgi:hypothetical protein
MDFSEQIIGTAVLLFEKRDKPSLPASLTIMKRGAHPSPWEGEGPGMRVEPSAELLSKR